MNNAWIDRVNADEALVRRGRSVALTFLFANGDAEFLVAVRDGRIVAIADGGVTMPDYAFSLRTTPEAWSKFCEPVPPPGYHDLLALVMHDRLRLGGNLHPFMSNLMYFKGVMGALRQRSAA